MEDNTKNLYRCESASSMQLRSNNNLYQMIFANITQKNIIKKSKSIKSYRIKDTNKLLSNISSQNKIEFNSLKYKSQKDSNNNKKDDKNKNNINENISELNLNNKINEEYQTRIRIPFNDLIKLSKEYLVDLIQFIDYSCSLTLEDSCYTDSTFSIFKIEKNKIKQGYNIIIDKTKCNINDIENNSIKEDMKIENKSDINIKKKKNEKIKRNFILFKDTINKNEENFDKKHNFKFPIFCSFHNNRKFQNLYDYLFHCKESHKDFVCEECGKKFIVFNKFKKTSF